MGKASRDKGIGFERGIAIKFRPFFPKAIRQLEYQEGLGVDLANTGVLRIQCKAYKRYVSLSKIKEAGNEGIPALVTKGDREPILIAVRLDDFLAILKDPSIIYGETNDQQETRAKSTEKRDSHQSPSEEGSSCPQSCE